MNKHAIKLIEYHWLVIAFFIGCVATLISELFGVTSSLSKYDSDTEVYIRVFVVLALTVYLGVFRVWPNKITIDRNSEIISIQEKCPYLFKPAKVSFNDIKSVKVVSRVATGHTSKVYYLSITDTNGKSHGFGGTSDEAKYEQWKTKILGFISV